MSDSDQLHCGTKSTKSLEYPFKERKGYRFNVTAFRFLIGVMTLSLNVDLTCYSHSTSLSTSIPNNLQLRQLPAECLCRENDLVGLNHVFTVLCSL